VIAWTIIYPSDVIRSRMMAEIDVEKPRYKSTLDCFRRSFEVEKFSWCYKVCVIFLHYFHESHC
jgi:hypothetical protein